MKLHITSSRFMTTICTTRWGLPQNECPRVLTVVQDSKPEDSFKDSLLTNPDGKTAVLFHPDNQLGPGIT